MRKKAFTLEQADRVIGVLKQFTAEVAKAASEAIKELAPDISILFLIYQVLQWRL